MDKERQIKIKEKENSREDVHIERLEYGGYIMEERRLIKVIMEYNNAINET